MVGYIAALTAALSKRVSWSCMRVTVQFSSWVNSTYELYRATDFTAAGNGHTESKRYFGRPRKPWAIISILYMALALFRTPAGVLNSVPSGFVMPAPLA